MSGKFQRCDRCHQYGWSPCRCRIIGKVWVPEWGDTRDDAEDIWSLVGASSAITDWAENRFCEDFETFRVDEPVTVAFLPVGERKARYFRVMYELSPDFNTEDADEDEVAEARKTEHSTRSRDRKKVKARA